MRGNTSPLYPQTPRARPPWGSPLGRKLNFYGAAHSPTGVMAALPSSPAARVVPPPPVAVPRAVTYDPLAVGGWTYGPVQYIPADVRDAFAYYDANSSGFLDYLELRHALRGYGFDSSVEECIELVRQHDDDGDGKLSPNEFYALLTELSRRDAHAGLAYEPMYAGAHAEAFAYYDANRSGFLDYLELQHALRGYGVDTTVEECIGLIRHYDDAGLGKLDMYSFSVLVDDLLAQPWAPPMEARLRPPFAQRLRAPHALEPYRGEQRYELPMEMPHASKYGVASRYTPVTRPPLLASTVRAVFERCHDGRSGVLDASRVRTGLLQLGCHLSLGEVSALVRRFGVFTGHHRDAVVDEYQFLALVQHVHGGPLHRMMVPKSMRPYEDIAPEMNPEPQAQDAPVERSGPVAWYGHRPEPVS